MAMETNEPWEHPDWYDLHDTTWTAGPEREPEHYRELLLALPPLDGDDHLVDVGAGTGKLALLILKGYPRLGQVTLLEPNERKLALARERLVQASAETEVVSILASLGETTPLPPAEPGSVVTIGSVLMPIMTLRGGTLADGLVWLRQALADVISLVQPGGWVYALETLAAPWDQGTSEMPVRRLNMNELRDEFERTGLLHVECMFRFRDRVVLRGQRPPDDREAL
jgi:SAM-dependent methyltransferase